MILKGKQQKHQLYRPEKYDKYEYLTGDEILPSDQSRIIEQAKFTYSPLSKTFEKQVKNMEEQGKKTNRNITNQTKSL